MPVPQISQDLTHRTSDQRITVDPKEWSLVASDVQWWTLFLKKLTTFFEKII